MKKLFREYNLDSIPDLSKLKHQLSKVNEIRLEYNSLHRRLTNQIGRYITAHKITEKDLHQQIKGLTEEQKKFHIKEWRSGNDIPLDVLQRLIDDCQTLWNTSEFVEKLKRDRNRPPFTKRTCPVCGLDVVGRKDKIYCSSACKDKAKSRRWRNKNPDAKMEANLRYYKSIMG